MSSPIGSRDAEGLDRCHHGDPAALTELREKLHAPILKTLLCRGATPTEAEDLLADLWADCVPGSDDRPSLLEKYNGRSTLQGWLSTIATNRWIDLKRRVAKGVDLSSASGEGRDEDVFDRMAAAPGIEKE